MHVMLDVDRLGASADAVILSIAAVGFEFKSGGKVLNGKTLVIYPNLNTQPGRRIEHGHVACRMAASTTYLGAQMQHNDCALSEGLAQLGGFAENVLGLDSWKQVEGIWGRPATVDVATVENAFEYVFGSVPWEPHMTRCVNTYYNVTNREAPPVDTTGLTRNKPGDRALVSVMQLQASLA